MHRNFTVEKQPSGQSAGGSSFRPHRPHPSHQGSSGLGSFTGTSEQYASTVVSYSERSKETYLHPGIHYRQLAQFLRSPSPGPPTGGSPRALEHTPPGFTHMIIHNLSERGQTKEAYDNETGLPRLAQFPLLEPDSSLLVFLRGYSSRDWLLHLGAQYKIDPEYFRRHLDFLQPRDFYDLPTLPSSSRNIVELRLVTICTREVPFTQDQMVSTRREEMKAVKSYQQKLGAHFAVGESIVRKFSIHSESTFTIEQKVTVCLKRKGRGWIAVIWLDNARDLSEGPWSPWLNIGRSTIASQSLCHPIIQHRTKAALLSKASEPLSSASAPRQHDMTQNACLLPAQYGSTLDPALMAADPLYALSELFNFVASSESQFLNLLQFQIEKDILFQPENMEQPVANLKHSKTLLDEHLQYLRNTLEVLRNPTMLDRHKTKQQGKESVDAALQDGNDLIDAALQDLVLDYQHLLSRAESLATQCLGGTNIIMNAAMLKEARKSITQTEIITRLTYLAFFFVPLSFTASLFGMNFKQLGTGILDIWWMFVVLVPLVLFSFAVSSWDSIVRVVRRGRNKTSDPTK